MGLVSQQLNDVYRTNNIISNFNLFIINFYPLLTYVSCPCRADLATPLGPWAVYGVPGMARDAPGDKTYFRGSGAAASQVSQGGTQGCCCGEELEGGWREGGWRESGGRVEGGGRRVEGGWRDSEEKMEDTDRRWMEGKLSGREWSKAVY